MNVNQIGTLEMNDTNTLSEYFAQIKAHLEDHLDRNWWGWSAADSLFLDWCLANMEAGQ